MDWVHEADGTLRLTVYDGKVEIATLENDGTDDMPLWDLRCKYLSHGFDILAADTEDEAKEEAVEVITSAVDGELDFLKELLELLSEMYKVVQ